MSRLHTIRFQLLVLWSLVSGPVDEDCRVRRRELP